MRDVAAHTARSDRQSYRQPCRTAWLMQLPRYPSLAGRAESRRLHGLNTVPGLARISGGPRCFASAYRAAITLRSGLYRAHAHLPDTGSRKRKGWSISGSAPGCGKSRGMGRRCAAAERRARTRAIQGPRDWLHGAGPSKSLHFSILAIAGAIMLYGVCVRSASSCPARTELARGTTRYETNARTAQGIDEAAEAFATDAER